MRKGTHPRTALGQTAAQMIRRYYLHDVARDSAALTYYLLFAIFPLLIFVSTLLGILELDVDSIVTGLRQIVPGDVAEVVRSYLEYVSGNASRQLMWFSLVFSIWFPMRATSCLLHSLRKAFNVGPPRKMLLNQLAILLFTVLPTLIVGGVNHFVTLGRWAKVVLEAVLKVGIFLTYMVGISKMKEIHRVFEYHGAEHKTIHCFEHGESLDPEVAMRFPRLHVRCGTAFIIMVMLIAIFVYTALGQPINALVDLTGVTEGPLRFVLIMLTRIILLPLIAGVSYEVTVKWAGTHPDNKLVRIILWPGMQMQRLTTNPPDEGMIECAIAAMNIVLAREELEARKAARQDGAGQ